MKRISLAPALIAALVIVAACSGEPASDDADATAADTPPPTTADDTTTTAAPTTTSPPTTTTTTTTTTVVPTTTVAADPCAEALDAAEALVTDLFDEIDEGVDGDDIPDELFDPMTAASSLIVEGCTGGELGTGVSGFVAVLAAELNDVGRTERARRAAGAFLDVLCNLDSSLLDDAAATACDDRAVASAPSAEQYRDAFITVWNDSFRADLVEGLRLSNDIESVDLVDFDDHRLPVQRRLHAAVR